MPCLTRSHRWEADGEIGKMDLLTGVKAALGNESVNEVIVSTLPAGISRWAKMDLSSRIGRVTHSPLTTVEAESPT